MKTIKTISIDVAKSNSLPPVDTKQGDVNSRYINVIITDNGTPINVDSDATVLINARRNDGEAKAYRGVINTDGSVTVPIAGWILENSGSAECDISVIKGDVKLTSMSFMLSIDNAAYTGTDISSDDNVDILVTLINDVKSIQTAESLRVTAENTREENETARQTAETGRVNAENTRISQENTRQTQEGTRQTNETARTEAETARQTAEESRNTTFDWKIIETNTAISNANTAADNANQKATLAEQAAAAASDKYTKVETDYRFCNALRKTATGIEQLTINDATANPVTRMVIAGYSEQSYNPMDPFPKPTDSGYKQINNLIDVSFDFNATSYNIPLKLLSLGVGSAATDGNTKDEYNVITGTGSRKVGDITWNGTEGWAAHSTPTIITLNGTTGYVYRCTNPDFGTVLGSSNTGERFALCTYLRQGFGSFASSNNIFPVNSIYGFASGPIVFVILDSNFPTVKHWTDFLASKSSTDKPCRVLYKKSTTTTITSTPINISTVLGVNKVTGLLGGSDITITYNRDINAAITELVNAIAAK